MRRWEQEPFTPSIENVFARLTATLRKAAERTVDALWTAIGRIVDALTPEESAQYFSACGYDPDGWDSAPDEPRQRPPNDLIRRTPPNTNLH